MVPQRGEKRQLVERALVNAREALAIRLTETSTQARLLEGLAETLSLGAAPERIEVFDNSHIQGAHAYGAMIVAGPQGFAKGQYRKYSIKSEDLSPGDDYGMMREVLTRRFARLQRQEADDAPSRAGADDLPRRPDLVLIDGGRGQLGVALEVLADLGIDDLPVLGVAKGPQRNAGHERFVMKGRKSFILEPRDPVLYFLQRLRDEAHRFAIGSHRARRKQAIGQTPLDEIPGIGPARKRALLNYFGSAKAVSRAGTTDLRCVQGISAQTAQTIYDFFHEQTN